MRGCGDFFHGREDAKAGGDGAGGDVEELVELACVHPSNGATRWSRGREATMQI